jgi:hypothetical protein
MKERVTRLITCFLEFISPAFQSWYNIFLSQQNSINRLISRRNHQPNMWLYVWLLNVVTLNDNRPISLLFITPGRARRAGFRAALGVRQLRRTRLLGAGRQALQTWSSLLGRSSPGDLGPGSSAQTTSAGVGADGRARPLADVVERAEADPDPAASAA